MGRHIIFLLSIFFIFFFIQSIHAFPQALYELEDDEKQIIIWSDEQVCFPVAVMDKAISEILSYIEKNYKQVKIIIHCVSRDYQERSLTKIAKHEHEADYAFQSLLLDTLASKYENIHDNVTLVRAFSDDQVIALIVSTCMQFQGSDIDIFVASSIVKELVEQFCKNGFVSKLIVT